uniref:Uncharacterized protein n=1 Tax=Hanusia phi TaxID=3032 RepID=A0A7S0HF66_9CRYP|mmetsp:Transcript_19540/g.44700  ORF Transcript_19540/g.44700 Transcript_19540/m.44700 type:complete len:233 (+) Transcript_19540:586-1284(+)
MVFFWHWVVGTVRVLFVNLVSFLAVLVRRINDEEKDALQEPRDNNRTEEESRVKVKISMSEKRLRDSITVKVEHHNVVKRSSPKSLCSSPSPAHKRYLDPDWTKCSPKNSSGSRFYASVVRQEQELMLSRTTSVAEISNICSRSEESFSRCSSIANTLPSAESPQQYTGDPHLCAARSGLHSSIARTSSAPDVTEMRFFNPTSPPKAGTARNVHSTSCGSKFYAHVLNTRRP